MMVSCSTRRVLGFTYMYISGPGQITLNQMPHDREEALTRGYPPVASSAGVNGIVWKFSSTRCFQHDESWNKLKDPASETTRQQRSWRAGRRLFSEAKTPFGLKTLVPKRFN